MMGVAAYKQCLRQRQSGGVGTFSRMQGRRVECIGIKSEASKYERLVSYPDSKPKDILALLTAHVWRVIIIERVWWREAALYGMGLVGERRNNENSSMSSYSNGSYE